MGEDAKARINPLALAEWLREMKPDHAFLELVSAMPSIPDKATGQRRGMGAASAFKFGKAVSAVEVVVQMCGIPFTLIVPAKWKGAFGLKGGDKEPSRLIAIQRFPDAAHFFSRKKDHQRAEAVLIAAYGLRLVAA